jgi:hypothetical protein
VRSVRRLAEQHEARIADEVEEAVEPLHVIHASRATRRPTG